MRISKNSLLLNEKIFCFLNCLFFIFYVGILDKKKRFTDLDVDVHYLHQ